MEYSRSRYEKILDEIGNVKEIFIAVRILKDGDEWEQGHWLTHDELVAVLKDESALNAITDTVAAEGELALMQHKADLAETEVKLN